MAGSLAGRGSLIAGALYDATASYARAFAISTALNVVAVGLLLLCRLIYSESDTVTAAVSERTLRI